MQIFICVFLSLVFAKLCLNPFMCKYSQIHYYVLFAGLYFLPVLKILIIITFYADIKLGGWAVFLENVMLLKIGKVKGLSGMQFYLLKSKAKTFRILKKKKKLDLFIIQLLFFSFFSISSSSFFTHAPNNNNNNNNEEEEDGS